MLKAFQTVSGSISVAIDFLEPEFDSNGKQITQYIAEVDYDFTAGGYDEEPDGQTLIDDKIWIKKIHVRKEFRWSHLSQWKEISRAVIEDELFLHPDQREEIMQEIRDAVNEKYNEK